MKGYSIYSTHDGHLPYHQNDWRPQRDRITVGCRLDCAPAHSDPIPYSETVIIFLSTLIPLLDRKLNQDI